jgi:hypothetical protein
MAVTQPYPGRSFERLMAGTRPYLSHSFFQKFPKGTQKGTLGSVIRPNWLLVDNYIFTNRGLSGL